MICGLFKIIVVAFACLLVFLAELSYKTEYYHASLCAAFIAVSVLSTFFAMKTKSNQLILYASMYLVGAIMYALMIYPATALCADYIYYEAALNFRLIIMLADSFIIGIGGISVIYRFYTMCRYGSDSDDIFDARVGIHKWAR